MFTNGKGKIRERALFTATQEKCSDFKLRKIS